MKLLDFYKVLARHFKLGFVNLSEHPVDESLLNSRDYHHYAQHLYLPWRRENGALWIATAEPGSPYLQSLAARDPGLKFVVTSKFDVLWELQRVAGPFFSLQATQELAQTDPERSAKMVVTRRQKYIACILLIAFAPAPLRTDRERLSAVLPLNQGHSSSTSSARTGQFQINNLAAHSALLHS